MHPDQKRCRPASSFQGSPSDPEDPVLGDISGLGKFYIVCGYTDMQVLGFTPERAEAQFGFLMNAFKYGAPPHAGLAFGLDRFVSILAGLDSIRDCIAFPKNNSGRDVMLDAPSELDPKQLDELEIKLDLKD